MDHLHTINQLIEKCREYQIEIHVALIVYNKSLRFSRPQIHGKGLKKAGRPRGLYTRHKEAVQRFKGKNNNGS